VYFFAHFSRPNSCKENTGKIIVYRFEIQAVFTLWVWFLRYEYIHPQKLALS